MAIINTFSKYKDIIYNNILCNFQPPPTKKKWQYYENCKTEYVWITLLNVYQTKHK